MRDKKFLLNYKIAHRGVHHTYLENTIMAFRECIKRGYAIELDVQLTKDQEVVVFHDFSLKRIFGVSRNVQDLTLVETKKYYIPTLQEVLVLVKGQVPILIEIKFDKKLGILEKKVANLLKDYSGKVAIMSFNPLSVFWFRLNRPNVIRGYLVNSFIPHNFLIKFLLKRNFLRKILKPDFIGTDLLLLKDKAILKIRRKYLLIGYTVQNYDEYEKYKEYGDNFIWDIKD